jgi:hypothetical protein
MKRKENNFMNVGKLKNKTTGQILVPANMQTKVDLLATGIYEEYIEKIEEKKNTVKSKE